MKKYNFFKQSEIKESKEERRNPIPVFSLICESKTFNQILVRNELEQEFVWSQS